ncbi:hypothetical protein TSAR_000327 [Trichomalopsis sarcophagae]|uniref:Uncharacterized protein n=1 Tax=Trichomalopsis sarcophagae TaxID=543379 RepID=A0A232EE04_9HYME|nr:hypothetical protein TSAR_000327 [Trichomalopsis sarcophagae]
MAVQFWGQGVEEVPELEVHKSDPKSDDNGYASEVGSAGEADEEMVISYRVISAEDEPSSGGWLPCSREDWDAPKESCLICGQSLGNSAFCLHLSGTEEWIPVPCLG